MGRGCFGEFHKGTHPCHDCPVVRSCKRESLLQIKSQKERERVRKKKLRTVENLGHEKVRDALHDFFKFYKKPVSTYRVTKDFKKYRNLHVSDTKIKELCNDLRREGRLVLLKRGKARYWHLPQ